MNFNKQINNIFIFYLILCFVFLFVFIKASEEKWRCELVGRKSNECKGRISREFKDGKLILTEIIAHNHNRLIKVNFLFFFE